METKSISEYGYIYCSKFKPIKLSSKFIHTEVQKSSLTNCIVFWKNSKEAKQIFDYDGYTLKAQKLCGGCSGPKNITIEIYQKLYNYRKIIGMRVRKIYCIGECWKTSS